jgi:hypothetical protein
MEQADLPAATAATTLLVLVVTTATTSGVASLAAATVATLATAIATTTPAVTTLTATSVAALATSVASTTTAGLVASTAATTATTETSTTITTGAALRGLVDTDRAAIKLNVVHGIDGSISISFLGVADETEATATTSVTVLDNDGFLNGAELLKLLAKSILVGVPGKASNKELRHVDWC